MSSLFSAEERSAEYELDVFVYWFHPIPVQIIASNDPLEH